MTRHLYLDSSIKMGLDLMVGAGGPDKKWVGSETGREEKKTE